MKKEHTHTQTPGSHLYTSPHLYSIFFFFAASLNLPPHPCSFRPLRSSSFLYDELLGGFSVWQEALSLIQDEKKRKKKNGRKEEDGEGG